MDQEEADALLFKAAATNNVAEAEAAIDAGADVNAEINDRSTVLHYAAACGHAQVIEALVSNGAGVDQKNENGNTPLHLAAALGNKEAVSVLVAAGANQTLHNSAGQTAKDSAHAGVRDLFVGHAARVTEQRKDKGQPQIGG